MLKITIPEIQLFDERTSEIITIKEQTLALEHSLVSLSKWESKWCKPFLTNEPKTLEESSDYIRCMTLTQNVDPIVYNYLPPSIINEINNYIIKSQTATTFSEDISAPKRINKRETITSELIYFWMIQYNIPAEYQKWHLSRLLALIRVCQIKTQQPKKMSKGDILRRNQSLNAARRAKLHTKG